RGWAATTMPFSERATFIRRTAYHRCRGRRKQFGVASARIPDRIGTVVEESGERGDMETTLNRISFHQLTEEQLVALLHTEEDRLTRDIVDEFVGRGERMIWRLTELCRDERSWTQSGPASWAPVHATF